MLIKLLGTSIPTTWPWRSTWAGHGPAGEVRRLQGGRAETPTDFTSQLGLIDEVLDTLRVPMVRVVDHEADDAIGTLAVRAAEEGLDAVIVTADRDFFQLVRPGSA